MNRHLGITLSLFGLTLLAAGCGEMPTAPIAGPPDGARSLALAAVDCDTAEDIDALIDQLQGDGTLNRGRATALRTRLAQAMRHEAAGRTGHAADAYARLVAQIEAWVAGGALDADDVADLLACAEDVLDGPDGPDPDPDPEPLVTIDGIRSPGEWDAATAVAVFTGGTFYYLNDETTLYLALEMADATPHPADGFRIRFDDTLDGVPTAGDNMIRPRMDSYFDLHFSGLAWGVVDTQQDGTAAGASSAGVNFFEVAFPLDSGDPNDFALSPGDAVGYCLQYLDDGVGIGIFTYPQVDGFDNCIVDSDQSNYAVLTTSP